MKIGITGYTGRVGTLLIQEIQSGKWPVISLAGGTTRHPKEENFYVTDNPEDLFDRSDAVIDFTTPDLVSKHAWMAAKHKTPYMIGTTGLNAAQEADLKDASAEVPVLYAANTSIGVNLLSALVEKAANLLQEGWDIEIFESHHKHKIDAPSGTALALGHAAACGRDVDLSDKAVYERYGETGARKDGAIGFSVARGGDVVGEHRVFFYGEGERIELSHMATDRALFARGAIQGTIWLQNQKPGLYSMRDALGLN